MKENQTIMITEKIVDLKVLSKIIAGEIQILVIKDIEIIRIMTEEIFMRIGKIIMLQETIVGETGVLRATFFHSHKTAIKLSFSPNFKVAC